MDRPSPSREAVRRLPEPLVRSGSSARLPWAALSSRGDRTVLDVRYLKLVRAIVRHGTIKTAAVHLHLTQPALSHQLADLEDRLGLQVFLRVGRRLVMTPAGERLVAAAEQVLTQLDETEAAMRGLGRGQDAVIRVSTECYTTYHWLAGALRGMEARFPRVSVQVVVEATRQPLDALLDGRIDVAIVVERRSHPQLSYRQLFEDEMVALMAEDHPLAELTALRPHDFAEHPYVLYAVPTSESFVFRHFLGPAGVSPRRVLHVELTEAIIELVRARQGVTVLAGWLAGPAIRAGLVVGRALAPPGIRRTWYAAARATEIDAVHLAAFIDQIRRVALSSPEWRTAPLTARRQPNAPARRTRRAPKFPRS
jgi:LysR family transcriptional regulator for metE and metH